MKIFHFSQNIQEIKEIRDYLTDNFGESGVHWWTQYTIAMNRGNQLSAKFYINITPEEESKLTYFLLKYI
jgi:hypothetical protein